MVTCLDTGSFEAGTLAHWLPSLEMQRHIISYLKVPPLSLSPCFLDIFFLPPFPLWDAWLLTGPTEGLTPSSSSLQFPQGFSDQVTWRTDPLPQ